MNKKDIGKIKKVKGRDILVLDVDSTGGYISIDEADLTPSFITKIKVDKDDKMGWKKYRKLLKDRGLMSDVDV